MTLNPFKVWRDYKKAREILSAAELGDDIVTAANTAVALLNYNAGAMTAAKKTIEDLTAGEPLPEEEISVSYLVTYFFEFTRFHNGGQRVTGNGMGAVTVHGGGITGWDNVMGIREFIATNFLNPDLPNLKVIINSIFELERWHQPPQKEQQPQQQQPANQDEQKTASDPTPNPSGQ